MEALACIDFFNLDDAAFPSAHGIYGLHAKPAVAHEPRNYLLGHADLRKRGVLKPFAVAALRHFSDRTFQPSACATMHAGSSAGRLKS